MGQTRTSFVAIRARVRSMLDGLHLGSTARGAKRSLRHVKQAASARVLWGWTPLVPEDAFAECCDGAIRSLKSEGHGPFGAYLEFGVSRGTSLAAMHHALERAGLGYVPLVGFDSFQGLPPEAEQEGWLPGQYHSTISATRKYLQMKGVKADRVRLIEGWFKDTLTQDTATRLGLTKASLIMVDCDIYSASHEALWFSEPLIQDMGVIFFDDWGWRADSNEVGQREAFAEFLAAFPMLSAEALPTYLPQARVFLVKRHAAPAGQ
jgi:O-methyltransferase